jgi:hypothetical protein
MWNEAGVEKLKASLEQSGFMDQFPVTVVLLRAEDVREIFGDDAALKEMSDEQERRWPDLRQMKLEDEKHPLHLCYKNGSTEVRQMLKRTLSEDPKQRLYFQVIDGAHRSATKINER